MGASKRSKMTFAEKGDCYRYVAYKVMVKKKISSKFLISNHSRGAGSIIFLVTARISKTSVSYPGSDNMNGLIKVTHLEFVKKSLLVLFDILTEDLK